jgi:hypothetical protein
MSASMYSFANTARRDVSMLTTRNIECISNEFLTRNLNEKLSLTFFLFLFIYFIYLFLFIYFIYSYLHEYCFKIS